MDMEKKGEGKKPTEIIWGLRKGKKKILHWGSAVVQWYYKSSLQYLSSNKKISVAIWQHVQKQDKLIMVA